VVHEAATTTNTCRHLSSEGSAPRSRWSRAQTNILCWRLFTFLKIIQNFFGFASGLERLLQNNYKFIIWYK
jgi:hypothetical protein